MMKIILQIFIAIAVLLPIIFIFVQYLRFIKAERPIASIEHAKQTTVQNNILLYCCRNEGESLDECEIYSISYENIGYEDVE